MTNPCTTTRIVFTVLNNMANVPGLKFSEREYRNIALIMHESTHRPSVVRDTKRQEIVRAVCGVFVGRTVRSAGFRDLQDMRIEAAELNTKSATECSGLGVVGCV